MLLHDGWDMCACCASEETEVDELIREDLAMEIVAYIIGKRFGRNYEDIGDDMLGRATETEGDDDDEDDGEAAYPLA